MQDADQRLLAESGYAGASMADIAKAADGSKATFQAHFDSSLGLPALDPAAIDRHVASALKLSRAAFGLAVCA